LVVKLVEKMVLKKADLMVGWRVVMLAGVLVGWRVVEMVVLMAVKMGMTLAV
jgi:hypothetical protein